ncbi:hypothetical protein [Pseudodesulfovibrio sp.]|uniref:hypothetical protein n=1 Tax=unclassified Pseudodesulfovibrio TaxID=2661612 RepID=UPI003B0045A5
MTGQTVIPFHYRHGTQRHFLDQIDTRGMDYDRFLTAFKSFKLLRSSGMGTGFKGVGWNVLEIFGELQEPQAL